MRMSTGSERKPGPKHPRARNAQSGRIEIGSVLVVFAVLGVIAYMGLTGTAWGDLSLLGKAIIVGIIAAAVFGAWVFNESSKWPNVNLGETQKGRDKDAKADSAGESGP